MKIGGFSPNPPPTPAKAGDEDKLTLQDVSEAAALGAQLTGKLAKAVVNGLFTLRAEQKRRDAETKMEPSRSAKLVEPFGNKTIRLRDNAPLSVNGWADNGYSALTDATVSKDGTRIAYVAAKQGEPSRCLLRVFDQAGKLMVEVPLTEEGDYCTRANKRPYFSPDGKSVGVLYERIIAPGDCRGEWRTFNLRSGALLSAVSDADQMWFSQDGKRAVVSENNDNPTQHNLRVISPFDAQQTITPLTCNDYLKAPKFVFSADGSRVVLDHFSKTAVWDAATGNQTLAQESNETSRDGRIYSFYNCMTHPTKRLLVNPGADNQSVLIRNLDTGEKHIMDLTNTSGKVRGFSPDGFLIVQGVRDTLGQLWDIEQRKMVGYAKIPPQ